MNDAGALGLVAGLSGVLAAAGFTTIELLDAFAPCRVAYRTAQTVQGSLACQSYAAIALLSLSFLLAALVLVGLATAKALARRRAASRGSRARAETK